MTTDIFFRFHYSVCGYCQNPQESPHITETEPEICFIDTEVCQAHNLPRKRNTRTSAQSSAEILRNLNSSYTYSISDA